MNKEFEISQNLAFCTHLLHHFLKSYCEEKKTEKQMTLHLFFPILPLVLHGEIAESFSKKQMTASRAGFYKAVDENVLFIPQVQRRMELYALRTFQSINLGFKTGLFGFNKEENKVVLLKNSNIIPHARFTYEYQTKLSASRRLGVWFAQTTEEEILSYLKINF